MKYILRAMPEQPQTSSLPAFRTAEDVQQHIQQRVQEHLDSGFQYVFNDAGRTYNIAPQAIPIETQRVLEATLVPYAQRLQEALEHETAQRVNDALDSYEVQHGVIHEHTEQEKIRGQVAPNVNDYRALSYNESRAAAVNAAELSNTAREFADQIQHQIRERDNDSIMISGNNRSISDTYTPTQISPNDNTNRTNGIPINHPHGIIDVSEPHPRFHTNITPEDIQAVEQEATQGQMFSRLRERLRNAVDNLPNPQAPAMNQWRQMEQPNIRTADIVYSPEELRAARLLQRAIPAVGATGEFREIDWEGFYTYLTSRGIGQLTAEQYVLHARKFYPIWKDVRLQPKEELFKKINQFVQITKKVSIDEDGERHEKYDIGNKKFTMYAVKHWMDYIGLTELFKEYYSINGKLIKSRPRKIPRKALSVEEITQMYNALEFPYKLIFAIQYETGCRISEVLNLKKPDIVLKPDGSMVLSARIKGGKIRHFTIVNSTTIDMVKDSLFNIMSDYLFHEADGTMIDRRAVHYVYKKCSKQLFNKKISTHWLRHSRAIHVYEKTKDIMKIKELLGHSNIGHTYGYLRSAGIELKEIISDNPVPW